MAKHTVKADVVTSRTETLPAFAICTPLFWRRFHNERPRRGHQAPQRDRRVECDQSCCVPRWRNLGFAKPSVIQMIAKQPVKFVPGQSDSSPISTGNLL